MTFNSLKKTQRLTSGFLDPVRIWPNTPLSPFLQVCREVFFLKLFHLYILYIVNFLKPYRTESSPESHTVYIEFGSNRHLIPI